MSTNLTARIFQSLGRRLDSWGQLLEVNPYIEKVQPSTKILKYKSSSPSINSCFVAPTASVIGNVTVGSGSSIWYNTIIRGDLEKVDIGQGSTIGDRATIYSRGNPTSIGNSVIIEAGASLHGCTIDDSCIIGAGAIIMDKVHIQNQAVIEPGSLVSGDNVVIKSGEVWGGSPAVFQRHLTVGEMAAIKLKAEETASLSLKHAQEWAKDYLQIEEDEDDYEQLAGRNSYYHARLTKEQLAEEIKKDDLPGHILNAPRPVL